MSEKSKNVEPTRNERRAMLTALIVSVAIKKIAEKYSLPSEDLFKIASEATLEINAMDIEEVEKMIDAAFKIERN